MAWAAACPPRLTAPAPPSLWISYSAFPAPHLCNHIHQHALPPLALPPRSLPGSTELSGWNHYISWRLAEGLRTCGLPCARRAVSHLARAKTTRSVARRLARRLAAACLPQAEGQRGTFACPSRVLLFPSPPCGMAPHLTADGSGSTTNALLGWPARATAPLLCPRAFPMVDTYKLPWTASYARACNSGWEGTPSYSGTRHGCAILGHPPLSGFSLYPLARTYSTSKSLARALASVALPSGLNHHPSCLATCRTTRAATRPSFPLGALVQHAGATGYLSTRQPPRQTARKRRQTISIHLLGTWTWIPSLCHTACLTPHLTCCAGQAS